MQTVEQVKALLLKAGFPAENIKLFLAQAMTESGGKSFNSNVAVKNNNLTGIVFIGKAFQKNAKQGLPMPKADITVKSGKGFYAHFNTLQDWANDYYRILSLDRGAGKPINATTTADLAHRLKVNGYYGASESDYAKLLSINHNKIV